MGRGGGGGVGGGGLQPPYNFSNNNFRAKNQDIFGQIHFIFVQAMEEKKNPARDFSPRTKLAPYAWNATDLPVLWIYKYTVRLKKVYTFQKSPHINMSKYFLEISIHVDSYGSLLWNDTKKIWRYCILERTGATFVKLAKIRACQELVFVLAAISQIQSRKKLWIFHILMVWWQFMNG